MSKRKTIVEVIKPLVDENNRYLDKEGNVIKDNDTTTEKATQKVQYYLLYWGPETNIIYDSQGNPVPYVNTVAVCQHVKSGYIETFLPQELKVIGMEVK